jgi:hypothetical protein
MQMKTILVAHPTLSSKIVLLSVVLLICFTGCVGNQKYTSCPCGGSIIAGGCKTEHCGEPKFANCVCNFYASYCGCDKISSPSSISGINENNIRELISVLKTNQFTSTIAKDLIRDLPLLIQYRSEQKPVEFYALAGQLDRITRQLPANEKQVLNNWIASKGGDTVFE